MKIENTAVNPTYTSDALESPMSLSDIVTNWGGSSDFIKYNTDPNTKYDNNLWAEATPHIHTIAVRDDSMLQFDDMEPMTGAELKNLLVSLKRIIEKDYPEELL